MAIKQSKHIFRGMNKDLSEDKQRAEYYIDAKNIRITAREDSTLFSVTNEKGNVDLELNNFMHDSNNKLNLQDSRYIGHCILNNKLVLFTKDKRKQKDQISVISLNPKKIKVLYSGNLNFDFDHPIEAIGDYETDSVQKVYWTDGLNQPRVINIVGDIKDKNDTQFDFVPEVVLDGQNIDVRIEKLTNAAGVLKAGTIQYFITFFNKFGQESNVVWQSPVLYVSPFDRGGAIDETISNSFKLELNVTNTTFDYIRIYSIQHTSEDTDLIGRRVTDIPVNNSTVTFIDNGSQGESINPPDLYYKGGIPIAVGTMSAKDQTLFLGNIKLQNLQTIDKGLKKKVEELSDSLDYYSLPAFKTDEPEGKLYDYTNQLNEVGQIELIPKNSSNPNDRYWKVTHTISSFKYLETYRFGLQFQDRYGLWSEPVWICDKKNTVAPRIDDFRFERYVYSAIPSVTLDQDIVDELKSKGYVKVRPLVVFPKEYERECIAQGVLNPTVYNLGDRKTNSPYAQASWFFRPYYNSLAQREGAVSLLPYKHNSVIQGKTSYRGEIEKAPETQIAPIVGVKYNNENISDSTFFIDQSIVTLNSPDIEFNDNNYDTSNCKFRLIGVIDVTGFSGSTYIEATSSPNSYYMSNWPNNNLQTDFPGTTEPRMTSIAEGYIPIYKQEINVSSLGCGLMCNGGFWLDTPYTLWGMSYNDTRVHSNPNREYFYPSLYRYAFTIFPWHSAGSLNNTTSGSHFYDNTTINIDYDTSNLKTKTLANLRYSSNTIYTEYTDTNNYDVSDIEVLNLTSGNSSMLKNNNKEMLYYGDIDKLLPQVKFDANVIDQTYDEGSSNYNKVYDWDIFFTDLESNTSPIDSLIKRFGPSKVLRKIYRNLGPSNSLQNYLVKSNFYNNSQVKRQFLTYNALMAVKTTTTHITYKSSKHAVIALADKDDETQTILPQIKISNTTNPMGGLGTNEGITNNRLSNNYLWNSNYNKISQDVFVVNAGDEFANRGFLLLGEIYRDIDSNIRFGGNSDDALEQNIWLPAGEIKNIDTDTTIYWTEGDTYFQRYDCLKTYPYSDDSMNNIIEILSFMCESRVNIAGRYDKNRGLIDNTFINEKNFNLINTVYNQKDNFFTYNILDDRFDLNIFKNQLTWSKIKSAGSEIDNWTNITLNNTLDLDGDKGEIISLNRYKNDILAFQPYGISQIIYNPNVQISTNNNMPIELANSGRVEGKRYLYEGIGCQNKWSICDKANGSIFFIDNYNKSIYKLSDQGLVSLTDIKGFRSWMQNNNPSKPWLPSSAAPGYDYGFMTFYDSLYKDVYFINNKTCLVYSDLLNEFVSFMGYDNTDMMCNINDKLYAIPSQDESNRGLKLYEQFASDDYCIFYGREAEPYHVEFIENQHPEVDKIFTNVEFRADSYGYDESRTYENDTFNIIQVSNEYQDTGEVPIKRLVDKPSLIQKKFRIWRIQIPYDTLDKYHKFNRIRNTWAKIKLSKQNLPDINDSKITDKMVLHDAVVTYHI